MAKEFSIFIPGIKRYETEEFSPSNPDLFIPISLTGRKCSLNCDHCRGKILSYMKSVRKDELFNFCKKKSHEGTRGFLLSGGSNESGEVDIREFYEEIKRTKDELNVKILLHTGLVRKEYAKMLSDIGVDGVMIDIIGSDETIRKIYHLRATVRDFESSLINLTEEGLNVTPHIVIGLHYGRIIGEHKALEIISRYPISSLVLVVITPIQGTPMFGIKPPCIDEVLTIFNEARTLIQEKPIFLGCARPHGPDKLKIDLAAIDAGLDGIAYPAEGTGTYLKEKGFKVSVREYCCGLFPNGLSF